MIKHSPPRHEDTKRDRGKYRIRKLQSLSRHDELAGLARLVEDDIVYQTGLAEAGGDDDENGAVVETVKPFERVGIVDADVFELGARFGFDVGAHDVCDPFPRTFALVVN